MSKSKLYKAFGKEQSIRDWAEEYGFGARGLRESILRAGEDNLEKILLDAPTKYTAFGETEPLIYFIKKYKITDGKLRFRMKKNGGDLEKAINYKSGKEKNEYKDVGKIFHNCVKFLKELPKNVWGQRMGLFECLQEKENKICKKQFKCNVSAVKSKHILSCGCFSLAISKRQFIKHGLTYDPIFIVWRGINERCHSQNIEDINYKRYGGRGITVCDEWRRDWKEEDGAKRFMKWAEEKAKEQGICFEELKYRKLPSKKKRYWSLERIDNDGPYSPENCKWATKLEQASNRRDIAYYKNIIKEKDLEIQSLKNQLLK